MLGSPQGGADKDNDRSCSAYQNKGHGREGGPGLPFTPLIRLVTKLVNGSRVGKVGPVDSCGQVGDLDPSLVNSHNLSWVGQVEPVNSCGQVRNIDLSGSK